VNNRPVEQRVSVTYDLHDRNALTWDDDRKVGAFITPSDSAIRNYASYIRTGLRDVTNEFLPEALQFAMQTYNALDQQGLLYQVDPASPFTQAQENPLLVDSISLPRETLQRITGDCDDITVLFNTILETAGYETGFVTIPGHIYSAINTGVSADRYDIVHPDRTRTLILDGEVWVLVEITLIGSQPFMDAWNTGMRQWRAYDSEPDRRGMYRTRAAQTTFRPVGLVETDLGLQYAEITSVEQAFTRDFERLSNALLLPYSERAREENSERSWNRYGVRAAMIERYDVARDAFSRAAQRSRSGIDPLINRGSVEYLTEQYSESFATFREALQLVDAQRRVRPSTRTTVLINLAKTAYQLEDYSNAETYFDRAVEIDPERAEEYSFIAAASVEGTRASDRSTGPPILFAESESTENTSQ
jgi:Tfp pilus assembly protein PilF